MNLPTVEPHERLIGTDVSLDVCYHEGYMMGIFHNDDDFDRETDYRLIQYYPEWVRENHHRGRSIKQLDIHLSFNDLVDIYKENRESVNSIADTENYVNFDDPCEYDFLHLASDLQADGTLI